MRMTVEEFDIARGMGQQQLDGLGLTRVGGVIDEPPETGLAQRGTVVGTGVVEPPLPGFPVQVVAAIVGRDDLLSEAVVAVGAAPLALTAPHTDEWQERE